MSDSTITILSLLGLTFTLLLILTVLLILGMKMFLRLLNYQTVENQRLRNQILTMGDLSALERLNRTTEVQRTNHPLNSEVDKGNPDLYDPQDVVTTPSGPVVMIDGTPVPLQELDNALVAQGWADDGDVDYSLSPEGRYVAGPGA